MNTRHYENYLVDKDARGVTTITIDVPKRPLNVLTEHAMRELEEIVTALEQNVELRAVVIKSGKDSGFLAGADVNVIAGIDSESQANHSISVGQQLFSRIEGLQAPTIAAIHGVCLGGGLELALACDYRIARNNSSTQIGLPEIKLGLIPGWGGTQRLPKRVGISTALAMILKGDLLDARKALKIALIDRVIEPEAWDVGVVRFVDDVLRGHADLRARSALPLWQRLADHTRLGRSVINHQVRRSIASKVEHYPALTSALQAVNKSFEPHSGGYAFEREEFVQLLNTATCRNLLRLFFAREKARQIKTWKGDADSLAQDAPIRTVGVVGAGAMGAAIGQLAGYRGFDVVLKEVNAAALQAGQDRLVQLVDELAKRKRMSERQRTELMNKFRFSTDDASLSEVDLVIEAVVEREDIKEQVFKMLDRVTKKTAILSSNTSSLSVAKMAEATQRSHLVAGLHFFNPVHRMELVEVVRTAEADDDCIARLVTFVRALGKTPVVTRDAPGFLVNRVLFPYLGEAVVMVHEGFSVEQIDREIRHFGMPMGPLELLDQVGIDVAHHVAKSLNRVLPEADTVVQSFDAMVASGHLGKKSGHGFYHYKNGIIGKPAMLAVSSLAPLPTALVDDFRHDKLTLIQRRLVYPMLAEAIRCYDERVVDQPWAIDLAMVLGTGFAPHFGGPLRLAETISLAVVLANLRRLQFFYGDRFESPKLLVAMVERGEKYFPEIPLRAAHERSVDQASTLRESLS